MSLIILRYVGLQTESLSGMSLTEFGIMGIREDIGGKTGFGKHSWCHFRYMKCCLKCISYIKIFPYALFSLVEP